MTREELKAHCEKQIKMCEMWAKQIGEEPSSKISEEHKLILELLEQEPCSDAISRHAVNTLIDELARAISDERCCLSRGRSTATIMRDILHLPPVIPQPKVGRWIYGEDNSGTGRDGWYCNQCGHFEFWDYSSDMKSAELNLPNLCPNCKAKMQEVKDDKRRN